MSTISGGYSRDISSFGTICYRVDRGFRVVIGDRELKLAIQFNTLPSGGDSQAVGEMSGYFRSLSRCTCGCFGGLEY